MERGYSRFSLEAVAAKAKVARPTIYRRYKSKVHLVAAALARLPQLSGQPTAEDDTRTQLNAVLELFLRLEKQLNPWALLGTALAEERRHPEWLDLLRSRLIAPRRALLKEVLMRGVQRGEVREDIDLETAVDLLTGPIFMRRIARGKVPPNWPGALLGAVWPSLSA